MLNDTTPEEKKTLVEMKSKKKPATAAAPVPGQRTGPDGAVPSTPAHQQQRMDVDERGRATTAQVLNAIDEGEGEAEVPRDFEVEEEDEDGAE